MTRTNAHGYIFNTGQCVSIERDWQQTYRREFSSVTAAAFGGLASALPNEAVYDAAIRASAGNGRVAPGPRPLSLVAANDEWSVYQCGAETLAVSTHDNHTEDLDCLDLGERESMGIPFGLTSVEADEWA